MNNVPQSRPKLAQIANLQTSLGSTFMYTTTNSAGGHQLFHSVKALSAAASPRSKAHFHKLEKKEIDNIENDTPHGTLFTDISVAP